MTYPQPDNEPYPQVTNNEPYPQAAAELGRALRLRAKGGNRIYTQELCVWTGGIFGHLTIRHLAPRARSYGLEVTHTYEGGWLERRHVFVIKGDPVEVIRFKWHFFRLFPRTRKKD